MLTTRDPVVHIYSQRNDKNINVLTYEKRLSIFQIISGTSWLNYSSICKSILLIPFTINDQTAYFIRPKVQVLTISKKIFKILTPKKRFIFVHSVTQHVRNLLCLPKTICLYKIFAFVSLLVTLAGCRWFKMITSYNLIW